MSEVAKIEGRVRYFAFKNTIKVMITPTDSLDDFCGSNKIIWKYWFLWK